MTTQDEMIIKASLIELTNLIYRQLAKQPDSDEKETLKNMRERLDELNKLFQDN
jgi:hypothetical protein